MNPLCQEIFVFCSLEILIGVHSQSPSQSRSHSEYISLYLNKIQPNLPYPRLRFSIEWYILISLRISPKELTVFVPKRIKNGQKYWFLPTQDGGCWWKVLRLSQKIPETTEYKHPSPEKSRDISIIVDWSRYICRTETG